MRSGYTDDCDDDLAAGRWCGRVESSIRGKRGQVLLRRLAVALDAMPEKWLAGDTEEGFANEAGEVCALGALMKHDGEDPNEYDATDHEAQGKHYDVAPCLIQEIEFLNDEQFGYLATPNQGRLRWSEMRAWVQKKLDRYSPVEVT